jgi:hypothetical protein
LAGGLVLAAEPKPIAALNWIDPAADPVEVLAYEPTECLRKPVDPLMAQSVEIGRAAFRTPLLLGGQAARAGLSCESCHRAGRGNPHFQFPGASGAPGTADVTLSLFSSRRGNGVFDPVAIPDLSGPRLHLKVAPDALPAFIRGLVVEEFDGAEPSPAVLKGLVAYVRSLDPVACPSAPNRPVTAAAWLEDARRAAAAARSALAAGDRPTALLLLSAARSQLGLIDERFEGVPDVQTELRTGARALADLQTSIRRGDPGATAGIATWADGTAPLAARLAAEEPRSLFSPDRLAAAAANRRLRGPPT